MSLLLYLNMNVLANTTFFLIVPLKSARCRQIYHSFPRSRQSARQWLFAELKLHLLFLTPITYLFLTEWAKADCGCPQCASSQSCQRTWDPGCQWTSAQSCWHVPALLGFSPGCFGSKVRHKYVPNNNCCKISQMQAISLKGKLFTFWVKNYLYDSFIMFV